MGKFGDEGHVFVQASAAHVDEVGVVAHLHVLEAEARHFAHDRHGKRGVLRIHDEGWVDGHPVVGEPVVQPGLHGRGIERLRGQRSPVGAGGDHHRAAAHQKLIDGEDLLVVEVRGIEHHEHIRGGWRSAVFQAGAFDVKVRAQDIAQALELVAGRLLHLHLLLHVGRDALRRLEGDGLQ